MRTATPAPTTHRAPCLTSCMLCASAASAAAASPNTTYACAEPRVVSTAPDTAAARRGILVSARTGSDRRRTLSTEPYLH